MHELPKMNMYAFASIAAADRWRQETLIKYEKVFFYLDFITYLFTLGFRAQVVSFTRNRAGTRMSHTRMCR